MLFTIKKIFAASFFSIMLNTAFAQLKPNTQESHGPAPSNIKIDGKGSEWAGLMAHDNATEVSYVIRNDDKNLYLAIQATDHTVINKILGGGVTLSINMENKKKLSPFVKVTYPVLGYQNRVWVNLLEREHILKTSPGTADSIMNIANKSLTDKSNLITVKGIKDIDTLISIYNRNGIKAACAFDKKLIYTYELSISLQKLGLVAGSNVKIAYNIQLPGVDMAKVYEASGQTTTTIGQGYVVPTGILPGVSDEFLRDHQPSLPVKVHLAVFTSPTDFWGEYQVK